VEEPQPYRIVIQGELSDRFEDAFHEMKLIRDGGDTVLVGDVVDQAHLHGLLEQIQALGLRLLSVNPADETRSPDRLSANG
jgi:hypothetical protein